MTATQAALQHEQQLVMKLVLLMMLMLKKHGGDRQRKLGEVRAGAGGGEAGQLRQWQERSHR